MFVHEGFCVCEWWYVTCYSYDFFLEEEQWPDILFAFVLCAPYCDCVYEVREREGVVEVNHVLCGEKFCGVNEGVSNSVYFVHLIFDCVGMFFFVNVVIHVYTKEFRAVCVFEGCVIDSDFKIVGQVFVVECILCFGWVCFEVIAVEVFEEYFYFSVC